MPESLDNVLGAQRERLNRFGSDECVDVHCHCLPGLDDGPATAAEAMALCRALAADGITTVIATPHELGRYDGNGQAAEIRRAVSRLNAALAAEGVPLNVLPGADVRLDERIPALLAAGRLLTLADRGKYLLVELPHEVLIDLRPLIEELALRRVKVILSHPERHMLLVSQVHAVMPWLQAGAVLQITAASLLGEFGSAAGRAAWYWLRVGAATLVATDAHDTVGRGPRMSEAFDLVTDRLGRAFARRVCIENPLCVRYGQDITLGMAPVRQGGWV